MFNSFLHQIRDRGRPSNSQYSNYSIFTRIKNGSTKIIFLKIWSDSNCAKYNNLLFETFIFVDVERFYEGSISRILLIKKMVYCYFLFLQRIVWNFLVILKILHIGTILIDTWSSYRNKIAYLGKDNLRTVC